MEAKAAAMPTPVANTGVSKKVIEELKKNAEDQEKKLMEMITNLSARMDDQVNVLEKSQKDTELKVKKIEGKLITMEKRAAVSIDMGDVKAAS